MHKVHISSPITKHMHWYGNIALHVTNFIAGGGLMKKSTTVWTNCLRMHEGLKRKCTGHEHEICQGNSTRMALQH